jgi:hypothetical protein
MASAQKDKKIEIRLSEGEYHEVRAVAKALGTTVSEYVRSRCVPRRQDPTEGLDEAPSFRIGGDGRSVKPSVEQTQSVCFGERKEPHGLQNGS